MAAIDTFHRTMRRLKKRALRMRLYEVAGTIHWRALDIVAGRPFSGSFGSWARHLRTRGDSGVSDRRAAFLYERAADAVERYIAARAKESA